MRGANVIATFRARNLAPLNSGSREDEIEKLEAQLRELKDAPPVEDEVAVSEASEEPVADDEDSDVMARVKGKDIVSLSEGDLIDAKLVESEAEGVRVLPTILAVVGAAVLVFLFAQVPIGQEDLSRYSATGSSGVTSIDLGDLNPDRKAP